MEPPYDQVDLEDGKSVEKENEQQTLGFAQVIFKAAYDIIDFIFFRFYEYFFWIFIF